MDFKNTFTSDRLLYEPVDPKDEATKAFLYEYTVRDIEVFGYAVHDTLIPLTNSASDQWVESMEKDLLSVIISLKPEDGILPSGKGLRGTPIGCMAISPIQMRSFHHRRGQLGISIASAYQNKGYGTEALKWLANWAFQFGNLHSLRLYTSSINERAIRVYEKAGFVCDGRQREFYYSNGNWYDRIAMSILEHEWRSNSENKDAK